MFARSLFAHKKRSLTILNHELCMLPTQWLTSGIMLCMWPNAHIGAGSLASPVYDSRLSLLPWTLSHVWVIQHAMSPLTKLRLCYVMGCGLCSTTSACDAPHGKRLSGSCPVASCFCAACFRMYACCCNTHAHMCTHTHASGSHVCMDRGPWYRGMELMVWFRHHSSYVHLCTVPEFQATEYYVQL